MDKDFTRYMVFKRKDVVKYLTDEEKEQLINLGAKICSLRIMEGRKELTCVVVEEDWPEYEPTWKAIEKRVDDDAG